MNDEYKIQSYSKTTAINKDQMTDPGSIELLTKPIKIESKPESGLDLADKEDMKNVDIEMMDISPMGTIQFFTQGCGCCSDKFEVKKGEEQQFIDALNLIQTKIDNFKKECVALGLIPGGEK
jgi:hypothetical protein